MRHLGVVWAPAAPAGPHGRLQVVGPALFGRGASREQLSVLHGTQLPPVSPPCCSRAGPGQAVGGSSGGEALAQLEDVGHAFEEFLRFAEELQEQMVPGAASLLLATPWCRVQRLVLQRLPATALCDLPLQPHWAAWLTSRQTQFAGWLAAWAAGAMHLDQVPPAAARPYSEADAQQSPHSQQQQQQPGAAEQQPFSWLGGLLFGKRRAAEQGGGRGGSARRRRVDASTWKEFERDFTEV